MATRNAPITGDLRGALRQVQLLETDLWDGELDPAATRKALERVRRGEFGLVPDTRRRKSRKPRKPVWGHLTPVENYAELIAARRDLRGWPISDELIEQFARQLPPHAGRLLPTSAKLWLGGDLRYNWGESTLWALDSARGAGLAPNDWVANLSVEFWHGSLSSGEPSLEVCGLDLQTYWRPDVGIAPRDTRQRGQNWPGLEVPWFLALNSQYMVQATGEEGGLPFLLAPGLVVVGGGLPWFSRRGRSFCAGYSWGGDRFHGAALVCFSESQQ